MSYIPETYTGRGRTPIVILTDFGGDGFYVGAMKGAILAVDPDAVLVDLTHSIKPYAVDEASFVLATVFDVYPAGSVFLAVVDPGVGGERKNLVFKSRGRYIVAPDNGIVSDIDMCYGVDSVFSVTEDTAAEIRKHPAKGRTFLGRDVFGPVAAFLARGGPVDRVGKQVGDFKRLALPAGEVGDRKVRGHGRYVDDFGNLLTDISREDIETAFGSTPLEAIRVRVAASLGDTSARTSDESVVVDGIVECFSEAGGGELAAILNSWDRLEISVNQGSAFDRLAVSIPFGVELTLVK